MSTENAVDSWAAYKKALVDIQIDDERVTVGPRGIESSATAHPYPDGSIYIITACDPGRSLSAQENAARQEQLARDLNDLDDLHLEVWPAIGRDRASKHSEPSFAVGGLDADQARTLGLRHGQEAIFEWTRDTWAVIPCGPGLGTVFKDGRVVDQPWFHDLQLLDKLAEAGLTPDQAALFESFGVEPEMVAGPLTDAIPFLRAAAYHDLDGNYVQGLLEESQGDAEAARELWAREEEGGGDEDDEDF